MVPDISPLGSVVSHHLAHISRSTGKRLVSGVCRRLPSDAVLCLWTLISSNPLLGYQELHQTRASSRLPMVIRTDTTYYE